MSEGDVFMGTSTCYSALKGTFISTETWRIFLGELLLVHRMYFKL